MVKAGAPIDALVDELPALLETGDILVDAGAFAYRRLDEPGMFHTRGGQDGEEVAAE
jgi:6-phosphogluconate dehydrogenase